MLEALCASGIQHFTTQTREPSKMSTLVIADLQKKDDLQLERMKEVIGGTAPTHHSALHDMHFTKVVDQSSPNLFFA
jgi:type VI protein secretion system component Hcp